MRARSPAVLAPIAVGVGVLLAGLPAASAQAQAADGARAVSTQPLDEPVRTSVDPPAAEPAAGGREPAELQAEPPPSPDDAAPGEAVSATPEALSASDDFATDAVEAGAPPRAPPTPSTLVTQLAAWAVQSGDDDGRAFVIVDKLAAAVFVFTAHGRLMGAAPALVGFERGDDSAPGVGDRDLSAIRPEERTTPAGRFVAAFGPAIGHRSSVLWVDYADAISLHPVVTSNPQERRPERLRSPTPDDHRISFGCINVPAAFYQRVVLKAFARRAGIVYVLPDTRPVAEVFPAFAATARLGAAAEAPMDASQAGRDGAAILQTGDPEPLASAPGDQAATAVEQPAVAGR